MATKEDILGQFQLFNINPSDEVLSKCKYVVWEDVFFY